LSIVLCNKKLLSVLKEPIPDLATDIKLFHNLELIGYVNNMRSMISNPHFESI